MNNPYLPLLYQAADKYGVPRDLAVRVVNQESGFNPNSTSSAGAYGITQLMPKTAASLGVNRYDPAQNIDGGMRYLGMQLAKYKSVPLALAAYNAGPGRTDAFLSGRSGLPNETVNYIKSITGSKGPSMPTQQPVLYGGAAPGALSSGQTNNRRSLADRLQQAAIGLMSISNPAGAAAMASGTKAFKDSNKFGLTPVWTKDAAGNYVPLQMNNAGGASPIPLPPGLKAVLPTTTLDFGNSLGVLRRGDTVPAAVYPKAGPLSPDEVPTTDQNGNITGAKPLPNSKLDKQIQPKEKQAIGQNRVALGVSDAIDAYTKLHRMGDMSMPTDSVTGKIGNAENYMANSPAGQFIGRLFGTARQTQLNKIAATTSTLLNAVRQSTGMSARAMDSDKELEFYQKSIGSPTNDYLSNLAILDAVDMQYGTGDTVKKMVSPQVYKQIHREGARIANEHPLPKPQTGTPSSGGITIRPIE